METLILLAAMAAPHEAFFTMTQICWDSTKGYELREDYKWATHSPTPVKVIQVKKGCKGKGNPECKEWECMYFSPKNKAELRG